MAVFVLVHGAWGGAHGFRKVRGPLRDAGHEVFTPSLTGIGERAHLTSPQVNLTTHIADVVNAVWYEDLSDIVLLGYSYGGAVVTGALEHIGDRVRHLVYLDAFVPGDGDTVAGLGGAGSGHGGDALIGCGGDRQGPVATRLERHRQRFAKNAVIVTQNQPHKHSPLGPEGVIRPNMPDSYPVWRRHTPKW